MYQVIARKYRPQTFEDVVGQEHVKTTLRNAIAQSRIAHGYIFSGQRGTGKTTMARILARCLNCIQGPTPTPCGVCASCVEISGGSAVDVIEIDAASNRGINEMRELRENVRYRPSRDKFKIFIIDEAHQITNEAFNALLKTIEEPPSWVVFILCTTESQKIPATIASRCQHFSFRSVDPAELVARMQWICSQEGVEADEEALAVIAQAGGGSVRDSLSALDQAIACSGMRLDAAEVRALLGAFSVDAFAQVSAGLMESDSARLLSFVDELERTGQNLQHFARELSRYFRNLLVVKISGEATRLIVGSERERSEMAKVAANFSEEDLTRYLQLTLDLYKDLQFSLQPRFHLEIGMLRLVHAGRLLSIEKALAGLDPGQPAPSLEVRASALRPVTPPAIDPALSPAISATPTSTGLTAPRARSPFELDRLKKSGLKAPQNSAPQNSDLQTTPGTGGETAAGVAVLDRPTVEESPEAIDWRERILSGLMHLGLTFTADAISQSEIEASGNELTVQVPSEFRIVAKVDELQKAARQQDLPPVRFKLVFVDGASATPTTQLPRAAPAQKEDEATQRAMSHPEVQRFREVFGGEVRGVRNLKF